MTQAKSEAYVLCRARELVATGQYADHTALENALLHEGFPEVRDLLDCDSLRGSLKDICGTHSEDEVSATSRQHGIVTGTLTV